MDDELRQSDLERERDSGHETDLRGSETEDEWEENENLGEEPILLTHEEVREESERAWDIERQIKKMSEREMDEFISDLDPEVKGKLWQALENDRND